MKLQYPTRYMFFWGMLFFIATVFCGHAAAEDPWADEVLNYNAIDPNLGFDTPQKTLGEPVGGGTYAPNNTSLHSVGRPGPAPGSFITLKFNTPVTDDPRNPMGLDCIVFGNSFWVGGNPERKWIEAGLIEISADANANGLADDPWYLIPGSRNLDRSVLPAGIPNTEPYLAGNVLNSGPDNVEYNWGYAELTPTQFKYLDNYVRPDDPKEVGLSSGSGGGDAFDIAWAVKDDGSPANLSQIDFVRISAFIAQDDPTFGFITPEIDAIADVAPDVDEDGDGILDEYETRVANTDPLRPESTVLALEIPPEEGDSAAGAELGTAMDAYGNRVTLYSNGLRSGFRAYNCMVDILSIDDPAPTTGITEKIKSSACRDFRSSETDFEAAQIQNAEFTIAYSAAEIAGLDEAELQPYRFDGLNYTQEGISGITKEVSENQLTFRSRYAGIFLLASIAGDGDTQSSAGKITLHATPDFAVVGEPGTTVTVTSEAIQLLDESIAPEGMYFTVSTTLGLITSADADPTTDGIQVAAMEGRITFTVQATTQSGTATFAAASLNGAVHGPLPYPFHAGTPVSSVEIYKIDPAATAPGPVHFMTSPMTDVYGNSLDDGTLVTLVAQGGSILTPDVQPTVSGHQLSIHDGVAEFSVRVYTTDEHDTEMLHLELYADENETILLEQDDFILDVVEMPLLSTYTLLLLVLCILVCRHYCRKRSI